MYLYNGQSEPVPTVSVLERVDCSQVILFCNVFFPLNYGHSLPPWCTKNIGTLSVQEIFFQFMGWLGVKLGDCPVGMVYAMG